jgi:adenylate cyclase class 2
MERAPVQDSLEIEGKFRVASHENIQKRLQELRIPCAGIHVQRDVYYASPYRDFGRTDEALRIRYEEGKTVLTYKGPKLATHGMKAREEVNVPVNSGHDLEIILQRLGFQPAYTVEKKRVRYVWAGVEISLDEVKGLGTFVEIEIQEPVDHPETRIEAIKRELGISGEHIPLSYLELLRLRETEDRPECPSPLH